MSLRLDYLDRQVSPAQDFYRFAVGGWLKKAVIPRDRAAWNFFLEETERNYRQLKTILNAASRQPTKNALAKAAQLYRLALRPGRSEKTFSAIKERIGRIDSLADLAMELAYLHPRLTEPFFGLTIVPDPDNSRKKIVDLYQSGLSLPDRDYYFEKRLRPIAKDFLRYAEKLLQMNGVTPALAKKTAATIWQIEAKLARSSMTRTDLRDPHQTTHKMTLAELEKLAPTFPWKSYFLKLKLKFNGRINISQPNFFRAFDQLLTMLPLVDLKSYLYWQALNAAAPYLTEKHYQLHFSFYRRRLLGLTAPPPRWKRAIDLVNQLLGEALGQAYVKKHFPPAAKRKMHSLIRDLLAAMKERLKNLDWMSKPTKKEALKKLRKMTFKIGYPDRWRSYQSLMLKNDELLADIGRARAWHFRREVLELSKPVDKKRWLMPPQTVNAYYNPPLNEIVFPAGILQPPMFSLTADAAVNYGAIGTVIAHEITHAFDDQGKKYDAKGNLRNWWRPADARRFAKKTAPLVKQYAAYTTAGKHRLNGLLTLGENIADLGGLTIAFTALRLHLKGKKNIPLQGFTPEQRFFLSFAQVWKNLTRPEYQLTLLKIDPHSPPQYRVNGAVANSPDFATAFGLPPAKKPIIIW